MTHSSSSQILCSLEKYKQVHIFKYRPPTCIKGGGFQGWQVRIVPTVFKSKAFPTSPLLRTPWPATVLILLPLLRTPLSRLPSQACFLQTNLGLWANLHETSAGLQCRVLCNFFCPRNLPVAASQSVGGVGVFLKHCFKAGKMIYLLSTHCRLCNLHKSKMSP